MQQPGQSKRRDWVIIAALLAVVAVSWAAFFLFWMRHKSAQPPVQQAARATATQAAGPAPVVQTRPAAAAAPFPAVPQSQPASAPAISPRDAALLDALQRAEQLKKQGKPKEALAELQHALQAQPAAASQPGQPAEVNIGDLLSHLGASGESNRADEEALLKAATQILAGTGAEYADLLGDVEAELNGQRRPSRPLNQAQPGQAAPGGASAGPAAPAEPEIIAYVFGQPISRQDIGGAADGPSDLSVARLRDLILEPQLDNYARNQGIRAFPGEVAVYQRHTNRGAAPMPAPNRRPQPRTAPPSPPSDPAAEAAIVRWKVAKALHESYGGTVITGQSGRLEPVGAYRDFLREQEKKAAFRIEDLKYRDRFWAWFDRDFGSRVVPPEKTNFGTPPWMKPAGTAQ